LSDKTGVESGNFAS